MEKGDQFLGKLLDIVCLTSFSMCFTLLQSVALLSIALHYFSFNVMGVYYTNITLRSVSIKMDETNNTFSSVTHFNHIP